MDRCIYEPIHGQFPDCDGACKKEKINVCPYYFVDEVWHIMNDWRKDAGVIAPIVWRYDKKRSKVCLYTTRPGYFIGLHGERYQRFWQKLKEVAPENQYIQNGIDIIECDDCAGD